MLKGQAGHALVWTVFRRTGLNEPHAFGAMARQVFAVNSLTQQKPAAVPGSCGTFRYSGKIFCSIHAFEI